MRKLVLAVLPIALLAAGCTDGPDTPSPQTCDPSPYKSLKPLDVVLVVSDQPEFKNQVKSIATETLRSLQPGDRMTAVSASGLAWLSLTAPNPTVTEDPPIPPPTPTRVANPTVSLGQSGRSVQESKNEAAQRVVLATRCAAEPRFRKSFAEWQSKELEKLRASEPPRADRPATRSGWPWQQVLAAILSFNKADSTAVRVLVLVGGDAEAFDPKAARLPDGALSSIRVLLAAFKLEYDDGSNAKVWLRSAQPVSVDTIPASRPATDVADYLGAVRKVDTK
jgi:hypothetical protein